MGGACPADRGVPPAVQDRPPRPAPHHRGDHLAARQRREVGARSRPSWARGGWRRRPSAAGRGWAPGNACWRRRSGMAGPRAGWRSSMAPASGRTTRPQARPKGGSSAQRDAHEALGRSRGGYGTKACVIADASGRAIGFALAPGQAHELPLAPLLLTLLSLIPAWIVADRGYASHAFATAFGASAHVRRSRPSATRRRRLSGVDLREPQPRRAPLGQAQGVACGRDPLREDRVLLHGRALHGRHHGWIK